MSGEPITITLNLNGVPVPAELSPAAVEALGRALAGAEAPPSPLMSVPEAAVYLRTTRGRIDNLLSEGSLTRVKEGGRTLIHRAEVEARARPERGPAR